jgi:hypothetical protein
MYEGLINVHTSRGQKFLSVIFDPGSALQGRAARQGGGSEESTTAQ